MSVPARDLVFCASDPDSPSLFLEDVWLVPIRTPPRCRSNPFRRLTRPLVRAVRHPILPQQRDPSTSEPGEGSTIEGVLYSSDGT